MSTSNSRHSAFTQPLISYTVASTWQFHDEGGNKTDTLFQFAPNSFDIKSIVSYVLECHRARNNDLSRTQLIPPGQSRLSSSSAMFHTARLLDKQPPVDLTAKVFWSFWSEVLTLNEISVSPRLAKTTYRKLGHVWSVYQTPTGDLDGAFVTHDYKGKVNPVFLIERRPFAELEEALTVTDRMQEFLDTF